MVKKINLSIWIAVSLALSICLGIAFQDHIEIADAFTPFGVIYVNLIKLVMLPLVFSSLVMGIASMNDIRKLGKMGISTVCIFLCTTAFAVVIGQLLALIFEPGLGVSLSAGHYEAEEFPNVVDTVVNIVPDNIVTSFSESNMLQIVFFSIVLGIAITVVGDKATYVKNFMESLFCIMVSITQGIMYLTPIGILGLVVPVVAQKGASILIPLLKVIAVFYFGILLQVVIVYCTLLKFGAKRSIRDFFKNMFPSLIVAFTTCSSAASLPVSLKCTQEGLGISRETSSFVLPIGATINMDGNALYQGIVALFVAQAYGIEITFSMMLTVVFVGTIASIGAAGVPGAGMVVLSTVLLSAGLPVDGVVLVAGIDRILDMGRTLVNVTGDAVTTCIVERIVYQSRGDG